MNTLSPSSPLSLDNSLDGSPDHNHNVPPPAHLAQSRELPVLDGVRLNHHSQSPTAKPKPYADALKFGLGGGGVMVILKSPHLNQNFVLNFQEVTLQGSFP